MRFSFRWFLMVFFAALLAAAWNGAGISRVFAAEGSTFPPPPMAAGWPWSMPPVVWSCSNPTAS